MTEPEIPSSDPVRRVRLSTVLPEVAVHDVEDCAEILGEDNSKTLTRAIFIFHRLLSASKDGQSVYIGDSEAGDLAKIVIESEDLTDIFGYGALPDNPE